MGELAWMDQMRSCIDPVLPVEVIVHVDIGSSALSICLMIYFLINILSNINNPMLNINNLMPNIENFKILLHLNVLLKAVVVRNFCHLWRLVLNSLDLGGLNLGLHFREHFYILYSWSLNFVLHTTGTDNVVLLDVHVSLDIHTDSTMGLTRNLHVDSSVQLHITTIVIMGA